MVDIQAIAGRRLSEMPNHLKLVPLSNPPHYDDLYSCICEDCTRLTGLETWRQHETYPLIKEACGTGLALWIYGVMVQRCRPFDLDDLYSKPALAPMYQHKAPFRREREALAALDALARLGADAQQLADFVVALPVPPPGTGPSVMNNDHLAGRR